MSGDARNTPAARAVEDRLLAFMRRELLSADAVVTRDDDLLSGDLIDSIGVLRLAAFVREEFQVDSRPEDFVVENFRSVAVLAQYVLRAAARAGRLQADT